MSAELGQRVKDRVTGFEGVVLGITTYVNGCRQLLVQPEGLKDDGDPKASHWIDEQRFDVASEATAGGPTYPSAPKGPA